LGLFRPPRLDGGGAPGAAPPLPGSGVSPAHFPPTFSLAAEGGMS